jgi:cell division protein FtsL
MKPVSIAIVLIIALMGSGLGLVYTVHQSRQLFIELQDLQVRRDHLEIEWELLQLEQSTLVTEATVDQAARVHLNMVVPNPSLSIYVTQ